MALPTPGSIYDVDCPRGLSDADCDVRCCACCHNEDRFDDLPVGPECATEFAEVERELREERRRP